MDPVLSPSPSAAQRPSSLSLTRVGGPPRWWDWALAADPGLGQIQTGWRTFVSMVTSLLIGHGLAGALGLPAFLSMLTSGVVGLVSAVVITESTRFRLAQTFVWLPVPFSAALSLSTWIQPHPALITFLLLTTLILPLALARFGPLGLLTGLITFVGCLTAEASEAQLAQCGRLALLAMVTSLSLLAARLLLCHPFPHEDLLRAQRAFVIEIRRVAGAAASALGSDAGPQVGLKTMQRALARLNVTTLIIDGRLAQPELAAEPAAAELLHQYLFDAEVAVQGIGQAVEELARVDTPSQLRAALVQGLTVAQKTDFTRPESVGSLRAAAGAIRLQGSVLPSTSAQTDSVRTAALRISDLHITLADSLAGWLRLGRRTSVAGSAALFRPSVILENGRLAGTGPASRQAAATQYGKGLLRFVPPLRAPLQIALAGMLTWPLVQAVDTGHAYWGLVGVLVALLGTNTTGERLHKLAQRAVGTIAGAVIGVVLLHLTGLDHPYWTSMIIVCGLSLGALGMQRSYSYMITGLVIALVQVYALSVPSSTDLTDLLPVRLADNVLGMLVATVCAALIFPVSTRRMRRQAVAAYVRAMERLISDVRDCWAGTGRPVRLRGDAREVDSLYHQVQALHEPLVRMPLSFRSRHESLLGLLRAASSHARSLATSADRDVALPPHLRAQVDHILRTLLGSLRSLHEDDATAPASPTWGPISSAVTDLNTSSELAAVTDSEGLSDALHELAALDEALAQLAQKCGATVVMPPEAATWTSGVIIDGVHKILSTSTAQPANAPVRRPHPCLDSCGDDLRVAVLRNQGPDRKLTEPQENEHLLNRLGLGAHVHVVFCPHHGPNAEWLLVYRRRTG